MKYTYEIYSKNQLIYVVTMGDLITEEVVAMGMKIMLKAKELKYKILFDNRLSRNRITTVEAYYWFSTHFDKIDPELRHIPSAYISNKLDWDFYSFFECTCNNKGIRIRAFQEENAAMEWPKSL